MHVHVFAVTTGAHAHVDLGRTFISAPAWETSGPHMPRLSGPWETSLSQYPHCNQEEDDTFLEYELGRELQGYGEDGKSMVISLDPIW